MITPTPETLASTALRRHAAAIAAGDASVSTLALLVGGSIVSLLAGSSAAPAVAWLRSLGTNVLAAWLDQWARTNPAHVWGVEQVTEPGLMEELARDLQRQLMNNRVLATDVAMLLERT